MAAAGFCTYATEDENSASRVPAAATSAAYLKKLLRNRQKQRTEKGFALSFDLSYSPNRDF